MGMFSQMGDMYKLQKEAKRLKKELAKTHISAEENGVKVVVTGEQEIVSLEIIDESLLSNASQLSNAVVKSTNKAMKKAQTVAAEKMKPLMGDMGLGQ